LSYWVIWVIFAGRRTLSHPSPEQIMPAKTNGNTARGGITRKEAVRQALGALAKDASRADIQKFIKDKYGFEMTLDHISSCKSEIQKEKGAKKATVAGQSSATKQTSTKAASAARGGSISLRDIETVKDLVERVGADSLKKLIDVMAR
jgi:hypothetical protein